MLTDRLIEHIKQKKNPCIVGIDPEWSRLPDCYKYLPCPKADAVFTWAADVIDCIADLIPAVKPQMAFYEVYGADGFQVFQKIVAYAHSKGVIVIDDSKRNDIGNTSKAYAYAHLTKDGPINADFLTVTPFAGMDSIQPFIETAVENDKGLFVLVKTSNPGSADISEAKHPSGMSLCEWLASCVNDAGQISAGEHGYSPIGAVVGATFPQEAVKLRALMPKSFFLVPGFGAQGGTANDVVPCFHEDGLGALVSSSRGILYHEPEAADCGITRAEYQKIVRKRTILMREQVYGALRAAYPMLAY